MTDLELTIKIVEILETTNVTNNLYEVLADKIIKEVVKPHADEIRDGYTELIYEFKRNVKDH